VSRALIDLDRSAGRVVALSRYEACGSGAMLITAGSQRRDYRLSLPGKGRPAVRNVRAGHKTGRIMASGGVAERFKAPVLKTGKGSRPS
jgi:hypothetical protein